MGAGYTGVVRRGHALQDLGSSAAKFDEVTTPCPGCGKPAVLETYESNGETRGLIKCASYRHSRRFGAIKGCPPQRISKEELEKLMPAPRKPRLSELVREEIRQGIEQTNLSIVRLNDLAGFSRNRLAAALQGHVGLEPEELSKVRDLIRERKEAQRQKADAEHEALQKSLQQASPPPQPVEVVEQEEVEAVYSGTPLDAVLRSEIPKDVYDQFRGFEHVCAKMHKLCPHLYQASVRRAAEVAF